jgi:hypothetical protein
MAGKRRRVRVARTPISNSVVDLAAAAIDQILRGEYFQKCGGRVVSREILEPLMRGPQITFTIHNHIYYGAYEMSTYTSSGQVGAMGDQARSDNNTFIQEAPARAIDLHELANELARVRAEMKVRADNNIEHDKAIGKIASAEEAAKNNDKTGALAALKGAGTWALEVAKSVAAAVVKDAIEGKLGM